VVRAHENRPASAGSTPCHGSLVGKIGREAIARQFLDLISARLGLGAA
jgi:hypothetical protein